MRVRSKRMDRIRWTCAVALACLLVVGPWAAAQAEDEAEAPVVVKLVTVRRSLTRFHSPTAVAGPNLATPADLIALAGSARWNADPGDERLAWLAFAQPVDDAYAFSHDVIIDLMQNLLPGVFEEYEGARIEVTERGVLEMHIPENIVSKASSALDRLLADWVPSASVQATLERSVPESRLRAMGSAVLWPERWTRVFFQKDEIPSVVDFNVEIAQEAVALEPVVANLVEGCELYVRLHLGESRSLFEYWIADLEHVAPERIDLSDVRGAPESSGLGVLNAPRTAVDRAFGCMVVLNGTTEDREIVWQREGRTQRLRVRLTAPVVAPPEPAAPADRGAIAPHRRWGTRLVRGGALQSPLEFESRVSQDEDRWITQAWGWLGAATADKTLLERVTLQQLGQAGLTRVAAPAPMIAGLRAQVAKQEAALVERTVVAQVWHVPEAAFRTALNEQHVAIGKPISNELLASFREGGGSVFQAVRMPVLRGVRAGFRMGQSVPGLIDMNAEVAQAAGALDPTAWALFEGVFADVTVRAESNSTHVRLGGEVVWADPQAGTMELVFRPPVSLTVKDNVAASQATDRRVTLPLLSGGSSSFDREVPTNAGALVLLHASVRGDDVTLVLVGAQ